MQRIKHSEARGTPGNIYRWFRINSDYRGQNCPNKFGLSGLYSPNKFGRIVRINSDVKRFAEGDQVTPMCAQCDGSALLGAAIGPDRLRESQGIGQGMSGAAQGGPGTTITARTGKGAGGIHRPEFGTI